MRNAEIRRDAELTEKGEEHIMNPFAARGGDLRRGKEADE